MDTEAKGPSGPAKEAKKDLKEGLSSARKPDLTHVRTSLMVYVARACEYGSEKYERANYLRETGRIRDAFIAHRGYLRAVVSHVMQSLDAMERHQANDPELEDVAGMLLAAYAIDQDVAPDCRVGASRLPHLCGAAASLNMAIEKAVWGGLLPHDPGQAWK